MASTFAVGADHKIIQDGKPLVLVPPHRANWAVAERAAPDLLVIHFTAGGAAKESVRWFQMGPDERAAAGGARSCSSAHLVVERDGSVVQMVPFNRTAYHAGGGTWEGRRGVNERSIGIEIANWGAVKPAPDGKGFLTWVGRRLTPESCARGKHRLAQYQGPGWEWWEAFPDAQVAAVFALAKSIHSRYNLKAVAGHDEVAPNRKNDPGPLWPMMRLRAELNL